MDMGISARFPLGQERTVADLPAALTDVEASLVAALRREEEEAADDLARSLVNDLDLPRALRSLEEAELLLSDGRAVAVTEVAADHVCAGAASPICVPFSYAVLRGQLIQQVGAGGRRRGRGRTGTSGVTLLERLRQWADAAVVVRVGTGMGIAQEGVLTRVTPDHIGLVRAGRETCLAWGAVREIQALSGLQPLSLEDSG